VVHKQGEMKDLNVIIKGDVQGSVEALAASLMKIDVEGSFHLVSFVRTSYLT
jgi:translation initiation factor IF-2